LSRHFQNFSVTTKTGEKAVGICELCVKVLAKTGVAWYTESRKMQNAV